MNLRLSKNVKNSKDDFAYSQALSGTECKNLASPVMERKEFSFTLLDTFGWSKN